MSATRETPAAAATAGRGQDAVFGDCSDNSQTGAPRQWLTLVEAGQRLRSNKRATFIVEHDGEIIAWSATGTAKVIVLLESGRVFVYDDDAMPVVLGLADPKARGIIAGLGLEADEASLVRLYLAGLVSVGYGLRQILEALRAQHTEISTVVVSGGAARSPLVRRLLADAAGIAIATVNTDEPVLLGSAILAAVAAGRAASVQQAMTDMSEVKEVIHPNAASAPIHARRYQAFLALQSAYRDLRRLDEEAVL